MSRALGDEWEILDDGPAESEWELLDEGADIGRLESMWNAGVREFLNVGAEGVRTLARAFGNAPANATVGVETPWELAGMEPPPEIAGKLTDEEKYRRSMEIRARLAEEFPTNPEYAEEFWSGDVPSAVGSGLGFVATTLATRGMGSVPSLITGGVVASNLGGASQFASALESGADVDTALKAADLGRLVGATEIIPIGRLLDRVDKGTGGAVKQYLIRAAKQGGEEAIQEAFAGVMDNLIASGYYDPERGLLDGVDRQAGAGAVAGVVMESLATAALPGRRRGTNAVARGIESDGQVTDEVNNDQSRSQAGALGQEVAAGAGEQQPQSGTWAEGPDAPIEFVPPDQLEGGVWDPIGARWVPGRERSRALADDQPGGGESQTGLTPEEVRLALEVEQGGLLDFDMEDAPRARAFELMPLDEPGGVPFEEPGLRRDQLAAGLEQKIAAYEDEVAADFRKPWEEPFPEEVPVGPAETLRYPQPEGLQDERLQDDEYRSDAERLVVDLPTRVANALPTGRVKPGDARTKIDEQFDDVLTAIARIGGVDSEQAVSEWGIDPADMRAAKVGPLAVFRPGGRDIDSARELLAESGFLEADSTPNDLYELVDRALRGERVFSIARAPGAELLEYLQSNQATRMPVEGVRAAVRKAMAGEKLGKRQARVVQAILDYQDAMREEQGQREVDDLLDADPIAMWEELTPAEQKLARAAMQAEGENLASEFDWSEIEFGDTLTDEQILQAAAELDRIRKATPAGPETYDQGRAADALPGETRGVDAPAGDKPGRPGPPSRGTSDQQAISQQELDRRAHEAATSPLNDRPEPTEAQKEAGNYKKGEPFHLHGLKIVIENPKGSVRRGRAEDGTEWQNTMGAHYGDIKLTEGADGDALDVFVGPNPESQNAYVIDQVDQDGRFDEHKVLLGFDSEASAVEAYRSSYDDDWTVGPVNAMRVPDLKAWIANGDLTQPITPMQEPNHGEDSVRPDPDVGGELRSDDATGRGTERESERDEAGTVPSDAERGAREPERSAEPEPPAVPERDEDAEAADVGQEADGSPPAPAAARKAPSAPKIDDFGEKIGGARKDTYYLQTLSDELPDDPSKIKLSTHFPEPDYQRLIDEGVSVDALALIKSMRDTIPAKPRKKFKLDRWVAQVEALRSFASGILDGTYDADDVVERMGEVLALKRVPEQQKLYLELGFPNVTDLRGYTVEHHVFSVFGGEKGRFPKWQLTPARAARSMGGMAGTEHFDTREEAVARLKEIFAKPAASAERKTKLDLYMMSGSEGVWIGKKVGARKYIDLKKFPDAGKARAYLAAHEDELLAELERRKSVPSMRRERNEDRVGTDYRKGKDVTPEEFGETFGFRGVEFGNWVENAKRQESLNDAYDGLRDLANLLGVEPKAISLNGELGLAFGARGKGGKDPAAAHYEPDRVVINLTKKQGAGSLAHEWWHALDNYFGRARGDKHEYLSNTPRKKFDRAGSEVEGIRMEVIEAWFGVMKAINDTDMPKRSKELDKRKTKIYWPTAIEMSARAFERFIIDKADAIGGKSDYLANIVSEPFWKATEALFQGNEDVDTYPYPKDEEAKTINPAYQKLFDTLETKETDKGVALFSSQLGRSSGRALSVDRVREVIAPVVLSWESGPAVEVVKRQQDLPLQLLEQAPSGAEIEGVSWGERVYLVAENIRSAGDARRILAHEAIGHFATQRLLGGREFSRLLERVNLLKSRDKAVKRAFAEVQERYGDLDSDTAAAEAIAIMAERGVRHPMVARALAAMRRLLRSLGFTVAFNRSELEAVLARAARSLRIRGTSEGGPGGTHFSGNPLRVDSRQVTPQEAREHGYREYAGKSFYSDALQANVRVNRRQVQKATSKNIGPELAAAYFHLPELIQRGTLSGTQVDRKARSEIRAHHYLDTATIINGKPYNVRVTVREHVNGHYHWGFGLRPQEGEAGAATSPGGDTGSSDLDVRSDPASRSSATPASPEPGKENTTGGADDNTGISVERAPEPKFSIRGKDGAVYAKLDGKWFRVEEDGRSVKYTPVADGEVPDASPPASPAPPRGRPQRAASQPPPSAVSFDALPEGWWDLFVRKVVDKYNPLKRTQKAIRDAGRDIPEHADAFLKQELIHGRIEDKIRKFEDELVQPLVDEMAAAGVSQNELDVYLYAKHAPERNRRIAEINPQLPEGGSGMTDQEAAAVIVKAREDGNQAVYERLAKKVYAINARRLEILTEAGLESNETLESWSGYEFYVPLKGGPNVETPKRMRVGGGFDIRGRESLRALGRRTIADSPLLNSIAQVEESIVRSEKNRVGKALLKLVQDNPNPKYWEAFAPGEYEKVRRYNSATKEVEYVDNVLMARDPSFVSVKIDGESHYIRIDDPRLLEAIKNLGPEQLNLLLKTLGKVNRYLAAINTSINPEFVISNAARDIQTAIYNIIAEQDMADGKIQGERLVKAILRDVPRALKGTYKALRDKGAGDDWAKFFDEYRASGAKVGFFGLRDLERRSVEFKRMVTMASGTTWGQVRKGLHELNQYIQDVNTAVENAVRLSAYVNARRAGISKEQAASLAKNLTVNFNRRGELGTVLNSLYLFANASIQGTVQFARVMRSRKAQGLAGAIAVGAFALAELNRLAGGDDEDERPTWEDVPDYVRERNLVIMNPFSPGEFFTFPLPYGYSVFKVLGDLMSDLVHGAKSPLEAAAAFTGALMGSFNPIGLEESDEAARAITKTMSPTALTPVVQLAVNENFYGGPIYSPYESLKPDSARGWQNTPQVFHWGAKLLNEISGGNEQEPGRIDIAPESLKHMTAFVTGGAGMTAVRSYGVVEKVATSGQVELRDVPFARRLYGETRGTEDRIRFKQRVIEIKQADKRYGALEGAASKRFEQQSGWKIDLLQDAKYAERRINKLKKQARQIEEDDGDQAELDAIFEEMEEIEDEFNLTYDKAKP